jgi:hypothetical protein
MGRMPQAKRKHTSASCQNTGENDKKKENPADK